MGEIRNLTGQVKVPRDQNPIQGGLAVVFKGHMDGIEVNFMPDQPSISNFSQVAVKVPKSFAHTGEFNAADKRVRLQIKYASNDLIVCVAY